MLTDLRRCHLAVARMLSVTVCVGLTAALPAAEPPPDSPIPAAAAPAVSFPAPPALATPAGSPLAAAGATTSIVTVHAVRPCVPGGARSDVVACVGNRPISLRELDESGGRPLHDALERVYSARAVALYQLLSQRLLEEQAQADHLTVEQLIEARVNAAVKPVTDAEVTAFLKDRTGGALDNPPRTNEAAVYLNLKRRADQKRAYVQTLFAVYHVQVRLDAPPPAPPEEVRGPLDPALGSAQAPVTLIVFSDYLCPYCRALSHTLDELLRQHPNDVRVVYRHFPIHPHADELAEAAQCAADQGHFPAFHRLLFDTAAVAPDALTPLAREAGLDLTAFSACLSSPHSRGRVEDDMNEGRRLGIDATPTLFINGVRLQGAQSLSELTARLEQQLKSPTGTTVHRTSLTPPASP